MYIIIDITYVVDVNDKILLYRSVMIKHSGALITRNLRPFRPFRAFGFRLILLEHFNVTYCGSYISSLVARCDVYSRVTG